MANRFKKVIAYTLIVFMLTLLPVRAEEVKMRPQLRISEWAISELHDAEMFQLIPQSWMQSAVDFTQPLTAPVSREILRNTSEKLARYQSSKALEFKDQSTPLVTRRNFLTALYALLSQFDQTAPQDAISYFTSSAIVQGDGRDLLLDQVCTIEEALILAARSVKHQVALQDAAARGFAWTVQQGDSKMVLLGSIHIASTDAHPINHTLLEAFNAADVLVMELDILKLAASQAAIEEAYYLPEPQRLRDVLTTDLYRDIERYLSKHRYQMADVNRLKPWALIELINQLEENAQSAASQDDALVILTKYGIDYFFNSKAYMTGKEIIELETLQEQIDVFDAISMSEQIAGLEQLMVQLERTPEGNDNLQAAEDVDLAELLETWQDGDKERFGEVFKSQQIEDTPFGNRLFAQRDEKMAEELAQLLNNSQDKTYFVAIGAGHFFSEDNIIKKLQAKGFKVRQFYH